MQDEAKSQALKTVKLINVSGERNNNKFWCCWVLPNGNLYVEYGRVGVKKPATHVYETGSQQGAETKLSSLVRDKLRKGYIEAATEEETEEELDWSALGENASEIERAIERIESIGREVKPHSQIDFNKAKGRFESSLGVVSTATLEKAKAALSSVERNSRNTQSYQFAEAAENYLKIIQIPTGMKLDVIGLLGNRGKIQQQKRILNLLSEGIELIKSTRQQILELTAELEDNGRSTWVRWGEVETADEDSSIGLEDERSRFISWS